MFEKLALRRRTDEGASAVEYGLLVALIAAVIVAAVFTLGGFVSDTFADTCANIDAKATGTVNTADCT